MIEIGLSAQSTAIVSQENTALTLGSGDMEVFATPAMIALMEGAAMKAIASVLDAGQTSVGVEISSSHIMASALGQNITATATVVAVDGRKVSFEITASDDQGVIGEGRHDRVVVDRERFLQRVNSAK